MDAPRSALFPSVCDVISGRANGALAAAMRFGLGLASQPYSLAVRVRNRAYDRGWLRSHSAGVPVISVGNLTAGGTGKTPCVEYIARQLMAMGVRCTILSRGYKSDGGINDESLMLQELLPSMPHLQSADRVALAERAFAAGAEALILDDGFQHRRLARDLDLVLVDATNPWGYDRLLPQGLLREPIAALRRADAIVLTRCDQVRPDQLDAIELRIRECCRSRETSESAFALLRVCLPQVIRTVHRPAAWLQLGQPERAINAFNNRPVAAFCGIGNPDAFRRTLFDVGCSLIAFRRYPDHHRYSERDIESLAAWALSQPAGTVIVTTHKDLVKVRRAKLGRCDLLALRVELAARTPADAAVFHELLKAAAPPRNATHVQRPRRLSAAA